MYHNDNGSYAYVSIERPSQVDSVEKVIEQKLYEIGKSLNDCVHVRSSFEDVYKRAASFRYIKQLAIELEHCASMLEESSAILVDFYTQNLPPELLEPEKFNL